VEIGVLNFLNQRCDPGDRHHIVRMRDYFLHANHLCLAFELLSLNLYELVKHNQFRGLSMNLLRVFLSQARARRRCGARGALPARHSTRRAAAPASQRAVQAGGAQRLARLLAWRAPAGCSARRAASRGGGTARSCWLSSERECPSASIGHQPHH
jgi:hypothetical protein